MSVEAMGWAFRQMVPPKPKIVLIAFADQADETTGRVCYGKTDLSHIAKKCSIPVRSLSRYIGALMRNGYMTRSSGKEQGKATAYWLCLDRPTAADYDEWQWKTEAEESSPNDEDENQPIEGSATMADPPEAEDEAENGRPPRPIDGPARVSCLTKEHLPANNSAPHSFDRRAQDLERGLGKPKEAIEKKEKVFVIENSRAWDAWIRYRRSKGLVGTLPTCWGEGVHARKRGWPMPSLFPPETGPPKELAHLSEADLDDFK